MKSVRGWVFVYIIGMTYTGEQYSELFSQMILNSDWVE